MSSKPTIKEIAKLAQVSPGTVDRVIHNRGEVSSETRKSVQLILDRIDYVPNLYARSLALNKTLKIGVIIPNHKKGEYFDYIVKGAAKASKNFKSLGLKIEMIYFDQNDENSFQLTTSRLFEANYDAFILPPFLFKQTKLFLAKCDSFKIPYVLIGSIQENNNAITNIGQDPFQGGRLAAELLHFGGGSSSSYLILNIKKSENLNVKKRIKGFHQYFRDLELNDITIEEFIILQEQSSLTESITSKLESIRNLNGIFIPNSKAYFLENCLPKDHHYKIVGYDLLDKNKMLLKKRIIHYLINQQPFEQTYQSIEFLYQALIINTSPPKLVSIPLDIVTAEKLMYY